MQREACAYVERSSIELAGHLIEGDFHPLTIRIVDIRQLVLKFLVVHRELDAEYLAMRKEHSVELLLSH
jgi:hypothetical protein